MAIKLVMFFNSGPQGWSETFYNSTYTPSQILAPPTGKSPFDAFFQAAINFRADPCVLYAARASIVGFPQTSVIRYLAEDFPNINDPVNTGATNSNDAQYLLSSLGGNRRFISIRGIYDGDVKRDLAGNDVLGGFLARNMEKYIKAMRDMTMQIRYTLKSTGPGNLAVPIQSVAPSGVSPFTSTITPFANPAIPYTVGQVLRFNGVPKDALPGFPATAQILAIGAGNPAPVTIGYTFRNTSNILPANMRAFLLTYEYANIATGQFVRFSERKTGRPFGSLRGAARATVRRH